MEKRPTSAIIDTEALRHNYRQLKAKLSPAAKMMAIVKADAYGHGDVQTARVLEGLGCEYFGVAIAEEGARLREAGIKAPVVVLGGVFPRQAKELFAWGLTPVVFDMETARRIDSLAREAGLVKKIHVKIDTGMGRLGIPPAGAVPFFTELKALWNISVEAALSHFSESEAKDSAFTKKQLAAFLGAIGALRAAGCEPGLVEMANSAAAASFPEARLDLVRPGIMLYGSYPAPHLRDEIKLRPVMKLRTEILSLKTLEEGSPISYGRSFVTKRRSVIATLPIGYGDGLPRSLSNKGAALVRGKRAPIIGVVCMDLAMCDVTDIPGVAAGDEAVLIGAQGAEAITAEEMASVAGTISYEVFCGISPRVPRVYI